MNMKTHWFQTFTTLLILLGITTIIFLYTSGYRISKEQNTAIDFKKTGMISAKSIPEGANTYINGVLKTATNDTIQALDPGVYKLKIVKNGFVPWEKDVEVFPELVTDITAVLISQSPRLEPLTNTGAKHPVISPTLTKLAYFSNDQNNPGILVTPFTNTGISLFKSDSYIAIEDTPTTLYSNGKSIEWSPTEQELLIQDANDNYYLVDISTKTTQLILDPEIIRQEWEQELLTKRTDFIDRIDIPKDMFKIATSTDSLWAPDEKKFLYKITKGDTIEYHVYNMEKPIPVGEKVDSIVFTTNINDKQPEVSWYADSFHLILVDANIDEEKTGSISLIRIDGTNKTEVYNNTMYSNKVYSTPGGDKLIFLTSFKSGEQTDLYTVGVR